MTAGLLEQLGQYVVATFSACRARSDPWLAAKLGRAEAVPALSALEVLE
jgi:hypothetical protein